MEIILGKIQQDEVPIKVVLENAEENAFFAIKGEVYSFDQRTTRAGKLKLTGEICDGEDEMKFQAFLNPDDFPNGFPLKAGKYVMLEGNLTSNQYTQHEWALNATAIALVDAPEVPKDKAEEKRVELTTFSQMSKMRSTLSVDSYFSYLSKIGHTHAAITDIHSAQAFPSAYAAAKKHGVQLIYGATLSLASEDNKVVYGPEIDALLKDITYVAFDVETTGLSVVHDEVIEIGATKYQNGVATSRFQRFIKAKKKISAFTTELTGITQAMIDEAGIPLEEVMPEFHTFIENAVMVAHNATFDRDFIIEAYKKCGMDFGERVIIDTLEIARSLDPDSARGNRLNTVAKRYLKRNEEVSKGLRKIDKQYKKELKEIEKDFIKSLKDYAIKVKNEKELPSFLEKNGEQVEGLLLEDTSLRELFEKRREVKNKLDENDAILNFYKTKEKNLSLDNHHRADEDAEVTAHILNEMISDLESRNITNINQLNSLLGDDAYRRAFAKEITVLATNEVGKKNLYKLLTLSHTKFLQRESRVTKTLINQYREGLLIGSGSHDGPLFDLIVNKPIEQAMKEAEFYDFIEIQPSDIASYLVAENRIESQEIIDLAWKKIYAIGKKLGKRVVATGYVHYLEEKDFIFHNILQYHKVAGRDPEDREGRKSAHRKGRHLRRTDEMKDAFPWIPEEEKHEVVVTNSRWVAEQCENFAPVPDKLFPPKIPTANEELSNLAIETAEGIYGSPLPEYVQARMDKELNSIIGNGFSVIYLIAQKLVKNSNDNGYLVGSRGSVGSSFVATMTGITEVNPLKPHYVSTSSKWQVFFDHEEIASGYDLPTYMGDLLDENKYSKGCIEYVVSKIAESLGKTNEEALEILKNHTPNTCPVTGQVGLLRDGQDIPFETFLGFKGDKVPDIDLNFSGEYQTTSHKYVEELFGEKYVFRAGTIGTVADKMAYGYAASYGDEQGYNWSKTKVSRYATILQGAKRTTGQHPGGILVCPDYMEPEDFTPVQHPAESAESGVRTSHFDFHSIHDNILKLDILGHDDPTILRMLFDLTGIDPKTVAPNNEKALKLFTEPSEALEIDMNLISANTGTLGVPEFGTEFVQQMILDTKPKTFAELVKISGLSHGTDVWLGNAQELINQGVCTLSSVIDTRDSIMVYLIQKGLEESLAFKIMENVRKGKGLTPEFIEAMREKEVPEWYIESCLKIKYMFPKAHAAAYVLSAMRIANYKVFHPKEFYTAVMTARYNDENIKELNLPANELRLKIAEYEAEAKAKENRGEKNAANKLKRTREAMKLVLEAKIRGVVFGNISIEHSHSTKYSIHDGVLIPPFLSIPGLGAAAAQTLYEEFRKKPFESIKDMVSRGIKPSNIDSLRHFGCLEEIEDVQYTLF